MVRWERAALAYEASGGELDDPRADDTPAMRALFADYEKADLDVRRQINAELNP